MLPLEDTVGEGQDEQIADENELQQPFVPFQDGEPIIQQGDRENINVNNPPQDEQPFIAPNAENLLEDEEEADAVDAEDIAGILELIGMQGNIVNLFQN